MTTFSTMGPYPTWQGRRNLIQPVVRSIDPLPDATTLARVRNMAFLGADDGDNIFIGEIISLATKKAYNFTQYENAARNIEARWDQHSSERQGQNGLFPLSTVFSEWLEIPVYPVNSITSVKVYDKNGVSQEITDFETDLISKPARVKVNPNALQISEALATIRIEANVGQEDNAYSLAVAQLAAYLYNNRSCSSDMAMKESGTLQTFRTYQLKRGL